jgi:hypothetical protein
VGNVNSTGSITVNPQTTTTYTCVASNSSGQVSRTVTVPVTPTGGGPIVIIPGCSAIVTGGSTAVATCATLVRTFDLNLTGSTSPGGNTPLSFFTNSRNSQATVLNPSSATPSIQLPPPKGDYLFDVAVTDSQGNRTVVTVTIQYL